MPNPSDSAPGTTTTGTTATGRSGGRAADPDDAARRPWMMLLYFYLAALVGLGFLITGTTTGLFGAKELALPQLGLSSSSYDYSLRRDANGTVVATDAERAAARARALDDRRTEGLDDLADGVIMVVVGLPTLLWHLRRAPRAWQSGRTGRPDRETGSGAGARGRTRPGS